MLEVDDGVFSWWLLLCVIAALNIAAWAFSAAFLRRHRERMSARAYAACQGQLVLSALYVFGCAFRSALPVFDVPRICLFDVWLSSAIIGRSVATVAELAFVAQWALMLRTSDWIIDSPLVRRISRTVVPLIVAAEICSWYSVLTTSNLGHVFEETLWGVSAVLIVIGLLRFHARCPGNWRPAVLGGAISGLAYAVYMFAVDVPRYWNRWIADEAQGQAYLTIPQGIVDALERRIVSTRWDVWQGEMVWMTLYFSLGVWISISLIHASMVQVRRMNEQHIAQRLAPVGKRPWLPSRTAE